MRLTAYPSAFLLLTPVTLALPPGAAVALLALLLGLWWAARPPRREITLALPFLVVAAIWLGYQALRGPQRPAERLAEAADRVEAVWSGLDRAVEATAAKLDGARDTFEEKATAFRHLEELTRRPPERTTWYLLDPDAHPVAWAGPGLLQDLDAGEAPSGGRSLRAGYTAVTLLAARPLEVGGATWTLVAGRSLRTDRLPGERPGRASTGWMLDVHRGQGPRVGEGPFRLVPLPPGLDLRSPPAPDLPPYLVSVALLLVGLLRVGRALGDRDGAVLRAWTMAPLLAGMALLAATAGAERWAVALLTVLLAAALAARPLGRLDVSPWVELGAGAVIGSLLLAVSAGIQAQTEATDLGARLIGPAHEATVRLAFFFLALATLRLVPDRAGAARVRAPWAWLALAAIGLGAAFHAVEVVGIVMLLLASALAAAWVRASRPGRRATEAVVLTILAAMLAALAWEETFHQALEVELETRVLAELEPPSAEELKAVERDLEDYFGSLRLAAAPSADPNAGDLAFAIWRDSPLARPRRLSALHVLPVAGQEARFSFGLPLDEEGLVDRAPPVWEDVRLPGWEEALVGGETVLEEDGIGRVRIRYWSLLRPGFRSASERPIDRVADGLLRGGPVGLSTAELLPGDVRLGIYGEDGTLLLAPWREARDLDFRNGPPPSVPAPSFRAQTIATRGEEGWRVLFLPIPPALVGLERVATHAVGPLLALAAVVALAVAVNLGRPGLDGAIRRAWRSYSQRLLILYTVILVVPVVVGNVLLLRLLAERLEREDFEAGVAALESAQRVLGEYALALEPGFGVETALDDELLLWLSRVLHHEVNLYWGSEVYAASKPELFSAGLLPRRIPGEIYRRLALEGSNLASRIARTGSGSAFQESYAPLRVPGFPTGRPNLFLSIPLRAQEVERASRMAAIRRRIVLVTSALVFLLAALGNRLARRFTEPLMEIVEGTQRIASGASTLGVRPLETELATLAEAIDEMAGRIASGRSRLLAEKQVVESVVDNIKSGVISVDRDGRVLLLNRRARELLALEVGTPLLEQLAQRPRFAAVAEFVRQAGEAPLQTTLRIVDSTAGEEGESEWTAVWVPLRGVQAPAALLVLEDVTEVLRGQRLEAWAEMARMIAHEIKNPLTPIRLSAEHLREVYAHRPAELDQVFERCTANILRQVEELRQISSEFSIYSRIPSSDLQTGDLAAAIEEVVDAYGTASPGGVRVEWEPPPRPVEARFDRRLLGRAVRNLLENAVRHAREGGVVEVRLESGEGRIDLTVVDDGAGVEPELLGRIFEPYFSTDDSGTGLGLPIARKIIEEHGGTIHAQNRPDAGLAVVVSLPRPPTADRDRVR